MTQNASDYSKLNELSREQERLQAELDNLLARWAYLEEVAEEQAKQIFGYANAYLKIQVYFREKKVTLEKGNKDYGI